MRVLMAEDSGTMRTILRRTLKALGIDDVVEAENGAEAIDFFEADKFDLVLADGNMLVRRGLDLTREIRNVDKKVPIIMITSEAERHRVMEAIQAGVSDYLIKPFTTAVLEQKLAKFAART